MFGIKRIVNAFGYSIEGLKSAYKSEAAFRQDLFLFLINAFCVFYFVKEKHSIIWLLFSGLLILLMELVNTAIEYVVDRIGTEKHELSGRAKDIGSSLVLLAIMNLLWSWSILIFY